MIKALVTILKDNWQWRAQIGRLAIFDLIKKSRGAVLSWAWLIIKPAMFVFVFWFALEIGLRAGAGSDPPYFLWLVAGLIPWFYMSDMLGAGSDVYHRYTYLVNKIKFPLGGIPTIYSISTLLVGLLLIAILFVIYFLYGMPIDIYLLQIPFVIIVMFIFFNIYSQLTSLLSALSKDFSNFIRAFIQPIFWMSGIIFNVSDMQFEWLKTVLLFNPITFFATAFRDAMYYKTWIWDEPLVLGGFALVFLVTLLVMLILYKRLHEEVPDAL